MSKHRFDLFRLSLRERSQKELFEEKTPSREEWIRKLFSQTVTFRHHGTDYSYIFDEDESSQNFIIGKIGRQVFSLENTPPEDGYEEIVHESWKAALVVIDPSEHADGQKVSIQRHSAVGKPIAYAHRLVSALEEKIESKCYLVAIRPIAREDAFWDFVERNKGKVTRVTFDLEVPNMFGGDDEFTREMRDYRDEEKAQRVRIEVSSPDGINTDSDRIKYTAHRALEQGTGGITAKALGKGNRFSSKSATKFSEIEIEEIQEGPVSLISLASRLANRILGRE